jgi:hypothetical protein
MKSKFSLVLLTFTPALFIYLSFNLFFKSDIRPPIAALNIVKCSSTNFLLSEVDTTRQIAPLFDNLGDYNYIVSTKNKRAQAFFNQGLRLTYAFNHAEAHRSFLEAARLDKDLAMAYWGQAYVLGPNINDQLPSAERRQKSFEAIKKAKSLFNNTTAKEQMLITALSNRYRKDSVAIKGLNTSYMNAMEQVLAKHPEDTEILTLYAASVMNTVPWNYWDKDGNPSPNISKAKAALEKAMHIDTDHSGANHYYIHMVDCFSLLLCYNFLFYSYVRLFYSILMLHSFILFLSKTVLFYSYIILLYSILM